MLDSGQEIACLVKYNRRLLPKSHKRMGNTLHLAYSPYDYNALISLLG